MFSYLIGTKSNMTHVYNSDGVRVAATRIKILPAWVTRISNIDEGKNVQVGYSRGKYVKKPQAKILENLEIKQALTDYVEFRVSEVDENIVAGSKIEADFLNPGDVIDIQGITKGKGFAGVVKRWRFKGGPKTHGQSDRHRAPGSIGSGTTLGRVFKGLRMAGKMGFEKKTVSNLVVLGINKDLGEIIISGSLPGANGSVVYVEKTGTKKNFKPISALEMKADAGQKEEAEVSSSENES